MHRYARFARSRRLALLLAAGGLVAACSILDEGDPETARVVVDGPESPTVSLVTSNNFVVQQTGEGDFTVELVESDTAMVAPRFAETYDLGPAQRFYAKVTNPDTTTVSVRLQVFIDDDERYNSQLRTIHDEALEFFYVFR